MPCLHKPCFVVTGRNEMKAFQQSTKNNQQKNNFVGFEVNKQKPLYKKAIALKIQLIFNQLGEEQVFVLLSDDRAGKEPSHVQYLQKKRNCNVQITK